MAKSPRQRAPGERPRPAKPDRATVTGEPKFYPQFVVEQIQPIRQRLTEIVSEVLADDQTPLDRRTRHIESGVVQGAHTAGALVSDKKKVFWDNVILRNYERQQREWQRLLDSGAVPADMLLEITARLAPQSVDAMSAEFLKRHAGNNAEFARRINEDVVASGNGWQGLADGVTGRHKTVYGMPRLMGEALLAVTESLLQGIRREERFLQPDQIMNMLKRIPEVAQRELLLALQRHPAAAERIARQPATPAEYQPGELYLDDCKSTFDVAYYSPKHQAVYGAHCGDSRSYHLTATGLLLPLTVDHEFIGPDGLSRLTRCIRLFSAAGSGDVDVWRLDNFALGDAIITLGDGMFDGTEEDWIERYQFEEGLRGNELIRTPELGYALQQRAAAEYRDTAQAQLAHEQDVVGELAALQQLARVGQASSSHFDDMSGAILRRTT